MPFAAIMSTSFLRNPLWRYPSSVGLIAEREDKEMPGSLCETGHFFNVKMCRLRRMWKCENNLASVYPRWNSY